MENNIKIGDIVQFNLDLSVCGIVVGKRGKRFYVRWFDEKYEVHSYAEDELLKVS